MSLRAAVAIFFRRLPPAPSTIGLWLSRTTRIEATILAEGDSQKPSVLGAGGNRLKKMATAARKDMEKMFGGKVYLGTFVKVRKSWTDDARVLRQLGYE